MAKKARDTPLSEITLRKYEPPHKMSKREMVRKVCLSLGLLQPGESRDIIVDILHLLITYKKGLPYADLEQKLIRKRKRQKQSVYGVTQSNVHRQLRRLRSMQLVDKYLNRYQLTERMSLARIFEERVVRHHLDGIINRVREYCERL